MAEHLHLPEQLDLLEQARRELRLSVADLWFRYFALGGMSSLFEMDAILNGALIAEAHNRDVLSDSVLRGTAHADAFAADVTGADDGATSERETGSTAPPRRRTTPANMRR